MSSSTSIPTLISALSEALLKNPPNISTSLHAQSKENLPPNITNHLTVQSKPLGSRNELPSPTEITAGKALAWNLILSKHENPHKNNSGSESPSLDSSSVSSESSSSSISPSSSNIPTDHIHSIPSLSMADLALRLELLGLSAVATRLRSLLDSLKEMKSSDSQEPLVFLLTLLSRTMAQWGPHVPLTDIPPPSPYLEKLESSLKPSKSPFESSVPPSLSGFTRRSRQGGGIDDDDDDDDDEVFELPPLPPPELPSSSGWSVPLMDLDVSTATGLSKVFNSSQSSLPSGPHPLPPSPDDVTVSTRTPSNRRLIDPLFVLRNPDTAPSPVGFGWERKWAHAQAAALATQAVVPNEPKYATDGDQDVWDDVRSVAMEASAASIQLISSTSSAMASRRKFPSLSLAPSFHSSPSVPIPNTVIPESVWVRAAADAMAGAASALFVWRPDIHMFDFRPGIAASLANPSSSSAPPGLSPGILRAVMGPLLASASRAARLDEFASAYSLASVGGAVAGAFASAVAGVVTAIRASAATAAASAPSLAALTVSLHHMNIQLHRLAVLTHCEVPTIVPGSRKAFTPRTGLSQIGDSIWGLDVFKRQRAGAPIVPSTEQFPTGAALLTRLYSLCVESDDGPVRSLLLYLFATSLIPYSSMLSAWIHEGRLLDPHDEFMITSGQGSPLEALQPQALALAFSSDPSLPASGTAFHLRPAAKSRSGRPEPRSIPIFLRPLAGLILRSGLSVSILRAAVSNQSIPKHLLAAAGPLPLLDTHQLLPTLHLSYHPDDASAIQAHALAVSEDRWTRLRTWVDLASSIDNDKENKIRLEMAAHARAAAQAAQAAQAVAQEARAQVKEAARIQALQDIQDALATRARARAEAAAADAAAEAKATAEAAELATAASAQLKFEYSRLMEETAARAQRAAWRTARLNGGATGSELDIVKAASDRALRLSSIFTTEWWESGKDRDMDTARDPPTLRVASLDVIETPPSSLVPLPSPQDRPSSSEPLPVQILDSGHSDSQDECFPVVSRLLDDIFLSVLSAQVPEPVISPTFIEVPPSPPNSVSLSGETGSPLHTSLSHETALGVVAHSATPLTELDSDHAPANSLSAAQHSDKSGSPSPATILETSTLVRMEAAIPPMEASELPAPISVLVDRMVGDAIRSQTRLSDAAVLWVLRGPCRLGAHLAAMKRYVLMNAGDALDLLCTSIFSRLDQAGVVTAGELPGILESALKRSGADDDPLTANLSLSWDQEAASKSKESGMIGITDGIVLTYKTQWPVSMIITDETQASYTALFRTLLRQRRVAAALSDVWWLVSSRSARNSGLAMEVAAAGRAFRVEAAHFVDILSSYMIHQVSAQAWTRFQSAMDQATSLPELSASHRGWLEDASVRALLHPRAAAVAKLIESIHNAILEVRAVCRGAAVGSIPQQQALARLTAARGTVAQYTRFLYVVIRKLLAGAAGRMSHLEELLVRLNYNRFYDSRTE